MSQENYQAKNQQKRCLSLLKEQHAEQTEDDGQAKEETPTEENNTGSVSDTGTCVHTES